MPISETAHRLLDAFDNHNLHIIRSYLRDDFQLTGNVLRPMNKTEYLALLEAYFTAFSNFDWNFTEAAQEGQILRLKFAVSGTHDGVLDLNGIGVPVVVEPTGKTVNLPQSSSEITWDENNHVVSQVLHQAAGATLSDLLAQIGAEMPLQG